MQITSKPKRQWENKGASYAKLWLFPRFTYKNDCDYPVKAVKFSFEYTDAFGDSWPRGYQVKQTLNLKPGATTSVGRDWGFDHYDFNDNYNQLIDANLSDLKPAFSEVVLVKPDGTKVTVDE